MESNAAGKSGLDKAQDEAKPEAPAAKSTSKPILPGPPSKGPDIVMLVRVATIILYVMDALVKTLSDTWPGHPTFEFITSFLGHLLSHFNEVQ